MIRIIIETAAGDDTDEGARQRAEIMVLDLQHKWPSTVLVKVQRERRYWGDVDEGIGADDARAALARDVASPVHELR